MRAQRAAMKELREKVDDSCARLCLGLARGREGAREEAGGRIMCDQARGERG